VVSFVYIGPALLGLLCLVAYGFGVDSKQSISFDATNYHIPELNHFIAHPLGFETAPGFSSPIPGYHWFHGSLLRLAGYARAPEGFAFFRVVHMAIGVLGLGLIAHLLARLARDPATAVLLSLLLCLSPYSLQMSYYFNTEAPAFLFFIAIIVLFEQKQPAGLRGAEIGSCALALVLMRHTMATTLIAPIAVLATRRCWGQAAVFCVYAGIAAVIIFDYWAMWGGLVSPFWQVRNVASGFTPHSALHVFALTGMFAAFFMVPLRSEFLIAQTRLTFWISVAVIMAIVGSLWWMTPSNYNPDANRQFSIIWTLARLTPTIGESSPIVLVLALTAAPMLGVMVSRMVRDRVIYADTAMCATYLAGQFLQNLPSQRYVEVPILIALSLFTARFSSGLSVTRWPLVALVTVYCSASVIKFLSGS
jgi:hypothetical protein